MDNKGVIVAPVSLKTYFILIIIGIVLFLGFWNYITTGNILPSSLSNIGIKTTCPEGIIPEKIELTEGLQKFYTDTSMGQLHFVEGSHVNSDKEYYNNSKTNWEDGREINLFDYDKYENRCHRGHLEGENINLVYCNNLEYSKSTTPVSKEGVIGKTETITYSIDLILEEESTRNLITSDWAGFEKEVPITTYKIISSSCS